MPDRRSKRRGPREGVARVISDLGMNCERVAHSRNFTSARRHDDHVRERWHQTVAPEDRVYVLGDFARGDGVRAVLNRARNLPGRITLLQGDLDPDGVGPSILNLTYGRRGLIVLCHFPLEDWERRARRSFHLHGHVPSCEVRSGPRRANVNAEALNYAPAPLSDVLDACDPWVALRKREE